MTPGRPTASRAGAVGAKTLVSNLLEVHRVASGVAKITRDLFNHPNLAFASVFPVWDAEHFCIRLGFEIRSNSKWSGERLDNRRTSKTVAEVIGLVGFGEFTAVAEAVASTIAAVIPSIRHPIHHVGFSLGRKAVTELKLYYLTRMYDETSWRSLDVMGAIDKTLVREAVFRVVEELGLEEHAATIDRVMLMLEPFEIEFLGLNLQKGKPPVFKLYFRPYD